MKLIGLTGGIGSGKSTVASIFMTLGIPVYITDKAGKELMHSDPEVKAQIIALLGHDAYTAEGMLNSGWIASQVFPDPALLDQLNAIVHPAVARDVAKWIALPENAHAPYLLKESALLLEEDLTAGLDDIILVVAAEAERMRRVMERDGVTQEQVMQRMKNQWPDEKKIPLADYVIYNDSGRSLIEQVMDMDTMIRHTPRSL